MKGQTSGFISTSNDRPNRFPPADLIAQVHKNGEQEFHAARTRLIMQSAKAVARHRIAPPFNLLQIIPGLLVDAAGELWWLVKWIMMCVKYLTVFPLLKHNGFTGPIGHF